MPESSDPGSTRGRLFAGVTLGIMFNTFMRLAKPSTIPRWNIPIAGALRMQP
jgi:hypothetical protein